VFTVAEPASPEETAQISSGGLLNAIIGSVMMCAVAMVIAVTIGVLAGTWLAEYGRSHPYAEVVRFVSDILLSAPSVLIGVVIWTLFVKTHILGFSGMAGAIALAIIALPIVTRTTEDVMKLQPTALRESGMALGAPHWTTIRSILWKSAGGGMLTAALLAFARISGETAPLLFTAFGNGSITFDLTKPMSSLPQSIFKFALTAYPDWQHLAWAGALIIAGAVLVINIIARILGREPRRS
jgi:phosphate transport system permease protein